MDPLAIIVLVLVFATFVLTFQGFFLYLQMKREEQADWFRRRLGLKTTAEIVEDEASAGEVAQLIRDNAADEALAFLGDYGEQLEATIRAAGSDMNAQQLITQMAVVAIAATAGTLYFLGAPGLLLGPLCGVLPYQVLKSKANQRAEAMLSQMPDGLELMSRAMQTGTGLSDAFRLVSEELPEPIAFEFGRVYEEVRFGKEWRNALQGLIDRNPTIFDLRLMVSSMLLQRDTGGNMIETLSSIAKTIRERYVFNAKVQAMTSEARTSGFVLAGMPLAVIMLVMFANPEYLLPLIEESTGHIVIMFCLTAYGTGLYMMQITANVEA